MITMITLLENKNYPNRKAQDLQFEMDRLNELLSVMEDGNFYQCKDLIGKVKYCWTFQAIGALMKKLRILDLVECVEKECEPITITSYSKKKIIVDGEVSYSACFEENTKTITPTITLYRKK